ncbi:hypothetical protein BDZ90DRAFT_258917 [Jaminaea rosea]|uniref:Uncharacterized protein n=1 Tax=Jaminaea rosea TaxID=1569628 RepID=A0A316UY67_9BASI|nr:hypothetical protein BDZ90DRAFT_258917 [Jaminaea rosea]PWN28843.1 hypothetical protein BDZ90DRAFT_258917 [Jaminaea rosea]
MAPRPPPASLRNARWAFCRFEPPYKSLLADDVVELPPPRPGKDEAAIQAALKQLGGKLAQRIAQRILPNGECLSDEDPDEDDESEEPATFRWRDANAAFARAPLRPLFAEARNAKGSSRTPLATINLNTKQAFLHPSGLPHAQVTLNVASSGTEMECSFRSIKKMVTLRHDLRDAQWLPSLTAAAKAYNLIPTLNNLSRAGNADEAKAVASLLLAFFAGPLHAAMSFNVSEGAILQVKEEFDILVGAAEQPSFVGHRGTRFRDKMHNGRYLLVLETADRVSWESNPGQSRAFLREDDRERDKGILRAMLFHPA